ncbi:MAG: helix-turn-helix domain-containing protein [Planctomycetes bacterium]|nr:helix-turn-helix domain-containing protein [Planctomycetota bacterium]
MKSQKKPDSGPDYATAADLAARLGIAPKTVWKLARNGKIPSVRIGRRCIRFDADAVVAVLTQDSCGALQ